jgi:hypothetical protein
VAIEGGGHFAVFMKSDAVLKELVARVLPLATRRRHSSTRCGVATLDPRDHPAEWFGVL